MTIESRSPFPHLTQTQVTGWQFFARIKPNSVITYMNDQSLVTHS
jgi:hypothetical protein